MKGGVSIVHLRIRELRVAAGLRQNELASRLNVSPAAVNQWERGVTLPTTETLPELARALGCSIGELFGEETRAAEGVGPYEGTRAADCRPYGDTSSGLRPPSPQGEGMRAAGDSRRD